MAATAKSRGSTSGGGRRGGSLTGGVGAARQAGIMRKGWNFQMRFVHRNAKCTLNYAPWWEACFIDPEDLGVARAMAREGRDMHKVTFAPPRKFLCFEDKTSPASERGDDNWTEVSKEVTCYYVPITPDKTLKEFCKYSVQEALRNSSTISVDGDKNIKNLKLGEKLRQPFLLAGVAKCFAFSYQVLYKTTLSSEHHYVVGAIHGDMGYIIDVKCTQEEELFSYVDKKLLPHLCDAGQVHLNVEDIEYGDVGTHMGLQKQLDLFGELRYRDTDAMLEFSFPMHAMSLHPDYSPIKSLGGGSVSCLTIDLSVYQRLADDFSEKELSGMPKYKASESVLFLEVEDLAKSGFGSVLSIDEYCRQKSARISAAFGDVKQVGSHLTLNIGPRCGRSSSATFTYDVEGSYFTGYTVKMMMVSSIMGNHGITALYFTRMGHGQFDAHLYLYQQLLRNVVFLNERDLTEKFSRFSSATNIRLKDRNDLSKLYPPQQEQMIQQHELALSRVDKLLDQGMGDAGVIYVGELADRQAEKAAAIAAQAAAARQSPTPPELAADGTEKAAGEETEEEREAREAEEEALAAEAASVISITDIPHLTEIQAWENEQITKEDEEMLAAHETSGPATGDEKELTQSGEEPPSASPARKTSSASVGRSPVNKSGQEEGTPIGDERETPMSQGMGSKRSSIANSTPTFGSRPGTAGGGAPTGSRPSTAGRLVATPDRSVTSPDGNSQSFATATATPQDPSIAAEKSKAGDTAQQQGDEDEPTEEELKTMMDELTGDNSGQPTLRDHYLECCEQQQCRPNSYLLKKLPTHPRFVSSIEELDMSSNYLGHSGFVAVLHFLSYLPKVHSVHFNGMTLDNVDVDAFCEMMVKNETITTVSMRNNPKITLPSVKKFTQLLSNNPRIRVLSLSGAGMGEALIGRIEKKAAEDRGTTTQSPRKEQRSSSDGLFTFHSPSSQAGQTPSPVRKEDSLSSPHQQPSEPNNNSVFSAPRSPSQ